MGIYFWGLDLDPLSTRFKMRYYCNHMIYIYILFLRLQDVFLSTRLWADIFLKPFRFPSFFFVSQVRKAGMRLARRALQGEEAIDFRSFKKEFWGNCFFWVSNIDWTLEYAYKYAMYYIYTHYIYRYKSISRICIVHCVTLKLHCDAYIYIVYVKLYSISLYHITLHACTCSIAAIFQHHPSCLLRCDRCLQALMAKLWPRRRVPICLLVAGVHFWYLDIWGVKEMRGVVVLELRFDMVVYLKTWRFQLVLWLACSRPDDKYGQPWALNN